jgi:hypothetical protein
MHSSGAGTPRLELTNISGVWPDMTCHDSGSDAPLQTTNLRLPNCLLPHAFLDAQHQAQIAYCQNSPALPVALGEHHSDPAKLPPPTSHFKASKQPSDMRPTQPTPPSTPSAPWTLPPSQPVAPPAGATGSLHGTRHQRPARPGPEPRSSLRDPHGAASIIGTRAQWLGTRSQSLGTRSQWLGTIAHTSNHVVCLPRQD